MYKSFPSPFGVEGISTNKGYDYRIEKQLFPSPFGVEGISTKFDINDSNVDHLFPSPFGVEGISTVSTKQGDKNMSNVSVSVWSGRYFNYFLKGYKHTLLKG